MNTEQATDLLRDSLQQDLIKKKAEFDNIRIQLDSIENQIEALDQFFLNKNPETATLTRDVPGRSSVTGLKEKQEKAPRKRREGTTMLSHMIGIMGSSVMNVEAVSDALKSKGLLPETKNPKQYISLIFSSNAKGENPVFERVTGKGRGHYRVIANKPAPKEAPVAVSIPEVSVQETFEQAGISAESVQ